MTISRTADGVWELRTRHGTLLAVGDLYTVITRWAALKRQGWSTVPYGQPSLLDGRRTVECTERHDCQCRACHHAQRTATAPNRHDSASAGPHICDGG